VAPAEIQSMVNTLNAWHQQCDNVLAGIDEQMETVNREALQKKRDREEYERLFAAKKEELKQLDKSVGGKGKRVISESAEDGRSGHAEEDDGMDLDDSPVGDAGNAAWGPNAGRRRIKGRFGGLVGDRKRR